MRGNEFEWGQYQISAEIDHDTGYITEGARRETVERRCFRDYYIAAEQSWGTMSALPRPRGKGDENPRPWQDLVGYSLDDDAVQAGHES